MKAKALFESMLEKIQAYQIEERKAIVYMYFLLKFSISRKNIHFDDTEIKFTNSQIEDWERDIGRLNNYEPLQYVLKKTTFYNFDFFVNKDVLIPRPETEELVNLIENYTSKLEKLRILDLCTGSGCIAISLAKLLPNTRVTALDISSHALGVAALNARNNGVKIKFIQHDIVSQRLLIRGKFELIVSNPPYVLESEMSEMNDNVLMHEPHLALFVPDDDPLKFYKAICSAAHDLLSDKGKLYFEINEKLGKDVAELMIHHGFENVIIQKDIHTKDRFVYGQIS